MPHQERRFNPYTENGGTILAIAGQDFAVIAGDTRQSEGYNIQTRYAPKVFRLTDKAVLAVNGFAADGNMFVQKVQQRLEWYHHAHNKEMPLRAIARLIQTMLYAKRFFPYYVYNILGGIEEDGEFLSQLHSLQLLVPRVFIVLQFGFHISILSLASPKPAALANSSRPTHNEISRSISPRMYALGT
ncbi:Proteasome subunit beta type-6 [Serendipita sp. 405]|nr:Proteasome subunit beta type-6 [Serendipita sp. 405]